MKLYIEKIKPYLLRLFLFCIVICLINLVYTKFFFESDVLKQSPIIEQIRQMPDTAEIVYLGESSNSTFHESDLDKRSIASFINDYYPQKFVAQICKGALHAGNYYVLLQNIPVTSHLKTVIVTLNLRSFDANWIYSGLETALQKEMVMIKPTLPPLARRFVLSFKGYDNKTEEQRKLQYLSDWYFTTLKFPYNFPYKNVIEWDKSMGKNGIADSTGKRDEAKTQLACHYIKTYAFQIDTNKNPRIQDFDNIVKLAKKRGWNLVFSLMAENTEKANKLIGNDLIWLMTQNRDLLIKRYRRQGVTVVDNLECVPDTDYLDKTWTTEHYSEMGRKKIAKNVALSIKHIYPLDFVDAKIDTRKDRNYFTNNCEGEVIWGQMQTLTNEMAHSGRKSSKVYKDNLYSITLEWPLNVITPGCLDSVAVEFYCYQTAQNKDAQLLVTLEGGKVSYYGYSKRLSDFNIPLNTWTKIKDVVKLPDFTKDAGLIKVFVLNPDNKAVFVDDISVHFL